MAEQMLSDVKVLDVSHHVSGPYLTKMLADYGADVIKIETPMGGDIARKLGPFPDDIPHPEKSGTFLHLNLNKRGITLNLASTTGQELFKKLVKDVDIVVENFEPGTMESWGLSYEEIRKINPNVVMTSISNFGQWGPYRNFKATEIVIFGMGGPMCATGTDGREPLKLYGNANLYQVALNAHIATMACLRQARKEGIGNHIDVSLFENMVTSIDRRGNYLLATEYSGRDESFRTSGSATGVLSKLGYPCKDGFILFTMGDRYFPRFARWSGHPELIEDPRLQTPDQRMSPEGRAIIEPIGEKFLLEHTMIELMETMQEHEIPGGAVYTVKHVVDDPHFQYRQYFTEIDHPIAGKFTYPGAPYRPAKTPWLVRMPAPTLGQHNAEVFCGQLGLSKAELVQLAEAKVI